MRKLLVATVVVVGGALVAWRMRARPSSPSPAAGPAPTPAPPPTPSPAPPPVVERQAESAPAGPPPATTNGERVVLMSVSSLQERGDDVTADAVVAHVAAGEIDPDEGTVEVLLERLASARLLAGEGGTYRLTASGQAALMDGSPARPSPAGDATEELSSPADTA